MTGTISPIGDDLVVPRRAVPPGQPIPLSYGQQRMCLFERMLPGTSANNVVYLAWLDGPLDRSALEWSLTELHRRHAILRTAYPDLEVQVVQPTAPVIPAAFDLRGAADPDAAAERLVAEIGETPFDLAAPPVGWYLVRTGEERHLLVMAVHHIAVDGWSELVINREISELYRAGRAGLPSPLPEPSVQYTDYALWQRDGRPEDEEAVGYWRARLDGAPAATALPFDRTPSEHAGASGRAEKITMTGLGAPAQALARSARASAFMVLQAGFAALLGRLGGRGVSGDDSCGDIVLGMPVAGRGEPELEELIGFFVNTLPCRIDLSGDPSLRELVDRVRESAMDAYGFQDTPLDRLVELLRPDREPGRQPLVQVMFQLHNAPTDRMRLDGLTVTQDQHFPNSSKLDLSVTMTELPDGFEALWTYREDLFDAATVRRMQRAYQQLMSRALAEPDQPMSQFGLLTDEETDAIARWNDTAVAYPTDVRVDELFEARAAEHPEAVALIATDGTEVSYAELDRRANQLAHHLQALGAGPEKVVAVRAEHGVELFVALLGVIKSGAAYTALDPSHPAERAAHVLADTGAPILVTTGDTGPPGFTGVVVRPAGDRAAITARPTTPPAERGDAGNLANVIYTSGSTGRAKGVMVPHRGLVNFLLWAADDFGLTEGSGSPMLGSVAFDLSLPNFMLPLVTGKTVTLLPVDEPLPALADLLRQPHRFSALKLTPGQLDILRRELPPGSVDSVGCFIVAGDVLRPEAVAAWREVAPNARIVNECGPTETTVGCSVHEVRDQVDHAASVPIGHPVGNATLHVLDEWGNEVPPGVPGELYVGGDGVSRGYLNRPGMTAEKFVPDPFSGVPGARMYGTGDLVKRLPDGEIEFIGRVDFQVKIRGYRVELGEVEQCLRRHWSVADVAVLTRDDAAGTKQLVAYVTAGAGVDVAGLREHVAAALPDYMVPSAWAVLDRMPINKNGKVDREALLATDAGSAVQDSGYVEPRTAVEKAVTDLWATVLGVDRVGMRDDFYQLGGHSLLATQVVARVVKLFPGLPTRDLVGALLRHPTVERFVAAVAEAMLAKAIAEPGPEPPAGSPIPLLDRSKPIPLSGGQQRMWFLEELGGRGAEYLVPLYLRLTGPLDVDALRRAVGAVVDRHEVLRTSVLAEGDTLAGLVRPPGSFALPLREVPADRVATVLAEEAARPIDLVHGLPVRGLLVRVSPVEHVLCLTVHHIASDAGSRRLVYRELGALYEAFRAGRPDPLPPLAFQYADHAAYQESRARASTDGHLEFWRDKLAGRTAFEVPPDLTRPLRRSAGGATCHGSVGPQVLGALERIARGQGATLFMTLLAATQLLLHRYTGRTDVTVGTTASERDSVHDEALVGLFINMLVLPGDLSGTPSFADLVGRARDTTLEAYAHQELTFDKLVEALAPERDVSRTPLFQVMVKFAEDSGVAPAIAGLIVEDIPAQAPVSKYDLSFEFRRADDGGLVAEIEYDTALYRPETGANLARHLERLLQLVAGEPDAPVGRLSLVGDEERAALRAAAEPAPTPFPDGTLHSLVEEQVARTPDAVALVWSGGSLTYRELDEWASRVAQLLRSAGARTDQAVGVRIDRSPAMVAAVLGVLKAGCAYLPIELETPVERASLLLRDSAAPVCLVRPGGALGLTADGCSVIEMPEIDQDLPLLTEPVDVAPDNLCAVYYTSGSTGKPKGVACPHGAWVNRMHWMQRSHGLRPGDPVLLKTTLTFDDVAVEILWPLMVGSAVAVLPHGLHRDPRAIIDAAVEHRVVHLQFVPSMLELVLDSITDDDVAQLGALRSVLSAGDLLRPGVVGRYFDRFDGRVALETLWGATEVAIDSTQMWLEPHHRDGVVPIGRPIDNNSVYVLDEHLVQVPFGVFGELYIGGAGLARGYLGDPARTAAAFLPHPSATGERLYRTGDWGRVRADGTVYFANRRDDQVKIRGVRTELGEVEAAARSFHRVGQAAVTTFEPVAGDKRLAMYVVAADPSGEAGPGLVAALREHLAAVLPVYAMPSAITVLPALPRTTSGKLDRRALPAPEVQEADASQAPPRDPTEQAIADIFGQVLGIANVGRDDDFFVLGGHSLLATRAIGRLRQAFAPGLPLSILFEHPTVAGAARRITDFVLAEIEAMSDEDAERLMAGG